MITNRLEYLSNKASRKGKLVFWEVENHVKVNEARKAGARLYESCDTVGISARTYERWYVNGEVKEDKRSTAENAVPSGNSLKILLLRQYETLYATFLIERNL